MCSTLKRILERKNVTDLAHVNVFCSSSRTHAFWLERISIFLWERLYSVLYVFYCVLFRWHGRHTSFHIFSYLYPLLIFQLKFLTLLAASWFCINGLTLNPDKSDAIVLGTRQRSASYSSLTTVDVVGSRISLSDHIKVLGVTLDEHLTILTTMSTQSRGRHSTISELCVTFALPSLRTWRKQSPVPSLERGLITPTLFWSA